jgi:hypothetical protein
VVVHNPAAAAKVREHNPDARVFEIPHIRFALHVPAAADVLAVRDRLGVAAAATLCGVFGHLRESKRIRSVVRACEAAGVPLLLAGACGPDLESAIEPYLSQVHRVGHTPADEFWTLAHAVDICVNLRYPPAGETSGIGVRLMSIGKPVVMTESLEVSRFPEGACIRIDGGVREQAHLEEVLRWLVRFPFDGRSIGAQAAAYIEREHSPDRVGTLYEEALTAAVNLH